MLNYIPNRYTTPKWQAHVKPTHKAFEFAPGVVIHNLWQLKQALSNLPEETVVQHLQKKDHHIANWVEFAVGDKDLAKELKKYNHRWGLIVALERQMMRTLNLPSYLAKRYLSTTDLPFTFVSGESAASLPELLKTLEKVSDETVQFHFERTPNDLSTWVIDVIGDSSLAEIFAECSNRTQMIRYLKDHIDMLKDAAD